MENPNPTTSIVPYDDDSPLHISLFDENPTIDDDDQKPRSIDENLTNLNTDFGVSDYDPYSDPVLLGICSNHLIGSSSTNADPGNDNCQILREITHADGLLVSKLGIFGTLGKVSHASLQKYTMGFPDEDDVLSQKFDFSNESISNVKQFLVQYFEDCKHDGYMVFDDPLCDFYQALGVGPGPDDDVDDYIDVDDLLQLSPTTSQDDFQMDQQEVINEGEGTSSDVKPKKISLSAQRERIAKMRLKDFAGYLHLTMEEASKRLNVCPTVMKKVCRRDGLSRWPHRKVKSIKRKISARGQSLSSEDCEERKRAKEDIMKLEEELANIYKKINDIT